MLISAEVRWFWKEEAPFELKEWFQDPKVHGCSPGGGPPARFDIYLVTGSNELGIKLRGVKGPDTEGMGLKGPLEFKGLIDEHYHTGDLGPFSAPIQLWCKWSIPNIDLGQARTCRVSKTRWLRKFATSGNAPVEVSMGRDEIPLGHPPGRDIPVRGCNVELTEVRLEDGRVWWTFCTEAYGDLGAVANDLHSTSGLLARRDPVPDLSWLIPQLPCVVGSAELMSCARPFR
jgi:hypothetical protein